MPLVCQLIFNRLRSPFLRNTHKIFILSQANHQPEVKFSNLRDALQIACINIFILVITDPASPRGS